MLGEEDATHSGLMETGQRVVATMYGQSLGTTSGAHYRIYSRKKGKPMRTMALPFTEANLVFNPVTIFLNTKSIRCYKEHRPMKTIKHSIQGLSRYISPEMTQDVY